MLRIKHYCPTTAKHFRKETKLGASVVIILTRGEGFCFLFFLDKLYQIFESEFFNKMRVSSLRLAENREEDTRLNHSRFLASLSTCIHESFAKNYVDILYMRALEKCMSFTNSAHKLELSNQFLKAFNDHDHAYISLEPSSGAQDVVPFCVFSPNTSEAIWNLLFILA